MNNYQLNVVCHNLPILPLTGGTGGTGHRHHLVMIWYVCVIGFHAPNTTDCTAVGGFSSHKSGYTPAHVQQACCYQNCNLKFTLLHLLFYSILLLHFEGESYFLRAHFLLVYMCSIKIYYLILLVNYIINHLTTYIDNLFFALIKTWT